MEISESDIKKINAEMEEACRLSCLPEYISTPPVSPDVGIRAYINSEETDEG